MTDLDPSHTPSARPRPTAPLAPSAQWRTYFLVRKNWLEHVCLALGSLPRRVFGGWPRNREDVRARPLVRLPLLLSILRMRTIVHARDESPQKLLLAN
jgi:hypothetical protein